MPGGFCEFREVDNLDTQIEEVHLCGHMWSNQELVSSMTWIFKIWIFMHVQIPKITHIVGSLVTTSFSFIYHLVLFIISFGDTFGRVLNL